MTRRRVVVIGAGLGGLAAALRLVHAGHEVTLVERREHVGGRAYQWTSGGYTFDMGPSLITMPSLLEELYGVAGTSIAEQVSLRPLDPFYRIHWADDPRTFDFTSDRERMLAEISRFSPTDAGRFDAFIAASKRIHEEGILVAGRRPFTRWQDFAALIPTMARLDAIRSLERFVGKYFEEPHLRQVFDFHSLFIGGDPGRVPAIYTALSYLQFADGVWYTDGGVYAIVDSFRRLIEAAGGRVLTGRRVEAIETAGGRVRGVRLEGGDRISAEVVVSNADAVATRRRLLEPETPDRLPWRWRTPRQTMSCYLLFVGTDRRYEQLHHHTLLVGHDYRGFIRDVTVRRRIPDELSLYLHVPSRTEPEMAAPGGESIYILLPVPNLRSGHDWTRTGPELRDRIVRHLEHDFGLEGFSSSIVVERSFTPRDFAAELEATDGNAFAIEPMLTQSAYFRQPNRDRTVGGLYYVGAGTHPGGGIPGVLLSAQVTTDLIARDLATRRRR
jgi:phytoene desaturase